MMSLLSSQRYIIRSSGNALKGYNHRWASREYRISPYKLLPSIGSANWYTEKHEALADSSHSSHVLPGQSHRCLQSPSPRGTILIRYIHTGSRCFDKEPAKASSKVEEAVNLLKGKAKDEADVKDKQIVPKKSLKARIVEEIKHYYHGFRLLFLDINISRKLAMKALRGETLSRREHRLLVRTTGDIFRLVPFSVFIIVPFMELLLPVFIKFFPGMLPSTFETASDKEAKMKKSLKVKLEMAKFLQQTLDDLAVQAKDSDQSSSAGKEFADFYDKMRNSTEPISNQDIIKFSKVFEDEITLDSLSRPQLIALCRVLEIQPLGTSNFLVFQLRMKLRSLAADDKMIQQEGIDSLNASELQQACRARGMRAYGLSEQRLRSQLEQWLDLSLNEKVPPSLLLLSRALLLPETVPTSDQLKATISSLPDTVITQTKAALGEREGKTDNLTRLEVLREEEKRIKEEQQEQKEEMARKAKEEKEVLLDSAKVLTDGAQPLETITDVQAPIPSGAADSKKEELTASDMETLEDALDSLSKKRKKLLVEKEELEDLKEEMADYQEDVRDLQDVVGGQGKKEPVVAESKAAKRLFSRVNKMINNMEKALLEIEKKKKKEELEKEEVVGIDELIATIQQIQKVPDSARLERLQEALAKLDDDKDGSIPVDDLLKMIEMIGGEQNVKLSTKQLDELALLLKREETLLLEDQIEKALEKQLNQEELKTEPKENTKDSKDSSPSKSNKSQKPPQNPPQTPSTGENSVAANSGSKTGSSTKQTL
ncbi:Mitochondrial proton/calcium exchanger protein [Frankliniella fusca]|uniref:Mitochondrial proton/calcium exchanger protein n=1 Tax=Frankliniella fusca TaxID=407009 RepID=A0AAE1LSS2_9NEOP|nr:Mitochondrial proton/calcium exchanger protein [Frankliniella fusca]